MLSRSVGIKHTTVGDKRLRSSFSGNWARANYESDSDEFELQAHHGMTIEEIRGQEVCHMLGSAQVERNMFGKYKIYEVFNATLAKHCT